MAILTDEEWVRFNELVEAAKMQERAKQERLKRYHEIMGVSPREEENMSNSLNEELKELDDKITKAVLGAHKKDQSIELSYPLKLVQFIEDSQKDYDRLTTVREEYVDRINGLKKQIAEDVKKVNQLESQQENIDDVIVNLQDLLEDIYKEGVDY